MAALSLPARIKKCAEAYYEGQALVSDREFDKMCSELAKAQPHHPILSEVGYGYCPKKNPVIHRTQVGSLPKVFELPAKLKGFVAEPKLDGITLVLTYSKSGHLQTAATRGDGTTGLNVTPRASKATGVHESIRIPPQIEMSQGWELVVRGELLCPKAEFASFFEPKGYKNPRSAVASIFNGKPTGLEKHLHFVAFQAVLVSKSGKMTEDVTETLRLDRKPAFYWCPRIVCPNSVETLSRWRSESPFPSDGIVLLDPANENRFRATERLAFKFEVEGVETTLEDIEWRLTQHGRLIPTAIVSPVELYGATVTRATLHNYEFVEANLGIQWHRARVHLTRANEIIPYVQEVVKKGSMANSKPLIEGDGCPACHGPTGRDGVHLVCLDPNCKGVQGLKASAFLAHLFPSKGLGHATFEKFRKTFKLNSISDVTRWFLKNAPSFEKLDTESHGFQLLREAMESAHAEGLDRGKWLSSLSLTSVGDTWSRKLGDGLKRDMSPKALEKLLTSLKAPVNIRNAVLAGHGLIQATADLPWKTPRKAMKKIAVSGPLSVPRSQFEEAVREKGFQIVDSISNSVLCLVCNDACYKSSKVKKARKVGMVVVDERGFWGRVARREL